MNIILIVALDLISKFKSLQQWKADYTVLCCQNLVLHANKQHYSNLQHCNTALCRAVQNAAIQQQPSPLPWGNSPDGLQGSATTATHGKASC